jgi:hypothetical protein
MPDTIENLRASFYRVFSNVPLGLRTDIVIVEEKLGPMSWNAVWVEVLAKSPLSEKLLKKMRELEII